MLATENHAVPAPVVTQTAPETFVTDLTEQSLRHPAVTHPWLQRLEANTLPDMRAALVDFAWHYYGYSQWFPRYLRAVIQRLEVPAHRALLAENLAEEKGHLSEEDCDTLRSIDIDPQSVAGIPHSQLFRRFCKSIGLGDAELSTLAPATIRWRTKFLDYLSKASPAAAVGALGLGTEGIVKTIYRPIVNGLRRFGQLDRRDYVFFELHCFVDDQHGKDLMGIAASLAQTAEGRRDLRAGMLTALELRREFWDNLLQRALHPSQVVSA